MISRFICVVTNYSISLYLPHFLYLVIHFWGLTLILCLGHWELCFSKHVSVDIFFGMLLLVLWIYTQKWDHILTNIPTNSVQVSYSQNPCQQLSLIFLIKEIKTDMRCYLTIILIFISIMNNDGHFPPRACWSHSNYYDCFPFFLLAQTKIVFIQKVEKLKTTEVFRVGNV